MALCFGLTSLEPCLSDFGLKIPQYTVIFFIMIINILTILLVLNSSVSLNYLH